MPRNTEIYYNDGNSFYIVDDTSGELILNVWTGRNTNVHNDTSKYDVVITITSMTDEEGWACIDIKQCWLDQVCGLCGKYDGDKTNDFTLFDGVTLSISDIEVEDMLEMTEQSWLVTNTFGNSWFDEDIPYPDNSTVMLFHHFDLYLKIQMYFLLFCSHFC